MKLWRFALLAVAFLFSGCSTGGLSTSSILGGGTPATPAPVTEAAPSPGDPTSRAFQVATVSARAVKCGYHFDPDKLKTSFITAELAKGASPADVPRIEQIYDVAFRGVTKATADQKQYCTAQRTKAIKADLNRHLAGDYSPSPAKKEPAAEGGLFSGWGGGESASDGLNVQHPMDNSSL